MSSSDLSRAFVPVESIRESKDLLLESGRIFASTIIWTKKKSTVINTHISAAILGDDVLYSWIPKDFSIETFKNDLQEAKTPNCYFSVSLTRANIFFTSDFLGSDSAGLKFSVPEKIFKVQRRKDFRLPLEGALQLTASFKEPMFQELDFDKRVLDISAGGLAIEVEREEERLFETGTLVPDLKLIIRQREIQVDTEVRYAGPILDPRGAAGETQKSKVGLEFKSLRKTHSQLIASYVLDESRKYFSKFL